MVQLNSDCTKESGTNSFFVPKLTVPALTIEIGLALIEDLSIETIEGLKAVPRRGLEIGGYY